MPHPHHYADYGAQRAQQFIAEAAHLHEIEQLPAADRPAEPASPVRGFIRALRDRLDELARRPVRKPA